MSRAAPPEAHDGGHPPPTTVGQRLIAAHSATIGTVQLEGLLTAEQAAKLLQVEPQTLANDRSTKRIGIPFAKIGGAVRYRPADLLEFIEKSMVRPASVGGAKGAV